MAWSLKPINPLGKILGVKKDSRSKNMATTAEKFAKKSKNYDKVKTNADFMKVADELDDDQLNYLVEQTERREQINQNLKPWGLDNETGYDSAVKWNLKWVKEGRERGERKEKNPKRK